MRDERIGDTVTFDYFGKQKFPAVINKVLTRYNASDEEAEGLIFEIRLIGERSEDNKQVMAFADVYDISDCRRVVLAEKAFICT